jgi:hypothetical protein
LTEDGRQSDESREQPENTNASMLKSFDPGSKVSTERDLHPAKERSESRSKDDGMQIDDRDVQLEKTSCPVQVS